MKSIATRRFINWLPWLFTIILACFLVVIHVRLYQYAVDDAYIHFRVARNLVETGKPYYNTNEAVKVSTSSGWSVFLAALYGIARLFRIDNHFALIISVINALIVLSGMFVYTKVIEALYHKPLSFLLKMLFQIPYVALLLPASMGLMETPFAMLVVGLGIYLLVRSNPLGFAFLGFAVFIRLELLILLGLTGLFVVLQRQYKLPRIIGSIGVGFIPLLIYDLYFFHTVIPQSIIAKSVIYSLEWLQPFISVVFLSLPSLSFSNLLTSFIIGTTILSIVLITTLAAYQEWKGNQNYWPLLLCLSGFLVAGGYILERAFIFLWYPPLYTIPVFIACFLCSISTNRARNLILRSLLCVPFLVSLISMAGILYTSADHFGDFYQFDNGSRLKIYLRVGAILNQAYPDATLLSYEIGGLGYSFRGRILDAAGLASPGALDFFPMTISEQRLSGKMGGIPPGYVKATTPDLIVSYDYFAQALLNDEVVNQYNIILIPAYLPEDAQYSASKMIWGSKYLRVYIRKDLPVSDKILALGRYSGYAWIRFPLGR